MSSDASAAQQSPKTSNSDGDTEMQTRFDTHPLPLDFSPLENAKASLGFAVDALFDNDEAHAAVLVSDLVSKIFSPVVGEYTLRPAALDHSTLFPTTNKDAALHLFATHEVLWLFHEDEKAREVKKLMLCPLFKREFYNEMWVEYYQSHNTGIYEYGPNGHPEVRQEDDDELESEMRAEWSEKLLTVARALREQAAEQQEAVKEEDGEEEAHKDDQHQMPKDDEEEGPMVDEEEGPKDDEEEGPQDCEEQAPKDDEEEVSNNDEQDVVEDEAGR